MNKFGGFMYAPQIREFHFEPISISARDEMHSRITKWNFRNSEFNFSNLFLWQPVCKTQYSIVDDTLLVLFHCRRDEIFLLPPLPATPDLDYKKALNLAFEYFESSGRDFLMRGITPEMKQLIEKTMPGCLVFNHERDYDDYVYLAQDLISLKGKKFHSKRNHINKFKSLYQYEYEEYDVDKHLDECLRLNSLWHENKENEAEKLMNKEHDAVSRSLIYAKQLGLTGAVIRIDGEVQAFTLGERLSPDTALIHMEKANSEIQGIYPIINQAFAERAWSDMTYINREEDMGLEGLRKAKLSYNPTFLVEKYSAKLK